MPARDGIPLPRITEPRASLLPPSEGWGLRLVAGSGTGGLLGQPLQNADVRALLQTQPFRCAGGEPSRRLVRNSLGTCRLSPRASLGSSREAILFSSRGPSQVGRKGVSRNYTFGRRTHKCDVSFRWRDFGGSGWGRYVLRLRGGDGGACASERESGYEQPLNSHSLLHFRIKVVSHVLLLQFIVLIQERRTVAVVGHD